MSGRERREPVNEGQNYKFTLKSEENTDNKTIKVFVYKRWDLSDPGVEVASVQGGAPNEEIEIIFDLRSANLEAGREYEAEVVMEPDTEDQTLLYPERKGVTKFILEVIDRRYEM